MIRLVFFFIGLAVFSGLIWHIGPSLIAQTANQLGFVSIGIILLPLLAGYLVDAYGWQLTLGHWADRVSFFHLFAVRMAGEAVKEGPICQINPLNTARPMKKKTSRITPSAQQKQVMSQK